METFNSIVEMMQSWAAALGPIALAVVFLVSCLVAWATNLITLPGNWIVALLVALYAWLGTDSSRLGLGLVSVLVVFVLALFGEAVEFLAGAAGAKRAGASRKSTLYAIMGSMGGAIVGAIIGVPVPILGPVIAAILFGGLGATAGAMYGEWTDGRDWKRNWSIGQAAFWGRTFGTLGKVTVGLAMLGWVALALCL